MEWILKNIIQETNHKFLNFFTLQYEIKQGNITKNYEYFLASRHDKDHLYALIKDKRPDGVVIPCYHINDKGEISFIITKQFRPAFNDYITSMPAGLLDENDDVFTAAKREALEEAGVIIDDLELICPPSPTSSGFSDETNSIVLGKIISFKENKLEEFEDISIKLVPLEEIMKMLDDPKYFFAINIRLLIKYLYLKFKYEK